MVLKKFTLKLQKKEKEKNVDLGSTMHVNKKIRLSHSNLFCY